MAETITRESVSELFGSTPELPNFPAPAKAGDSPEPTLTKRTLREFGLVFNEWCSAMARRYDRIEQVLVSAKAEQPQILPAIAHKLNEDQVVLDIHIATVGLAMEGNEREAQAADFLLRSQPSKRAEFAKANKIMKSIYERVLKGLFKIRDRVKHLQWDFDPASRNGPTFDGTAALFAYLDG